MCERTRVENAPFVQELCAQILQITARRERTLVGIAGPPGAGKSTLTQALLEELAHNAPGVAVAVPMDGFHFDNRVLDARGLRARKGAEQTFDSTGYLHALQRVRAGAADVAVPLFDRAGDFARAGAIVVERRHRIVVSEGNYLLLDVEPWNELHALFDLTVYVDVPEAELLRRLVQRWLDHGLPPAQAEARARSNDLRNARLVVEHSVAADVTYTPDG
ncbi:MAG: nucleoside triphosphate hydrolase [Gammaproteobacteria bacterium]|nr:nucleoside triphosphate hydrolase [Gammaproteobacteria bacterium]